MDCVLDFGEIRSIQNGHASSKTVVYLKMCGKKNIYFIHTSASILYCMHLNIFESLLPITNTTMRYMQSSLRKQSKVNKSFHLFPSILRTRYPIRPLTRTPPTPTIHASIIPRRIRRRIPI